MGLQAGPWRLTMDRTNWRLGRRDVNILMIGIVNRAIAIPVCWQGARQDGQFQYQGADRDPRTTSSGSSGSTTIASLLVDREFIGDAWLGMVAGKGHPRSGRHPHPIQHQDRQHAWSQGQGEGARFRDLKPGESRRSSSTPGDSRRPENPRPGPSSSQRSISRPANC